MSAAGVALGCGMGLGLVLLPFPWSVAAFFGPPLAVVLYGAVRGFGDALRESDKRKGEE